MGKLEYDTLYITGTDAAEFIHRELDCMSEVLQVREGNQIVDCSPSFTPSTKFYNRDGRELTVQEAVQLDPRSFVCRDIPEWTYDKGQHHFYVRMGAAMKREGWRYGERAIEQFIKDLQNRAQVLGLQDVMFGY